MLYKIFCFEYLYYDAVSQVEILTSSKPLSLGTDIKSVKFNDR